MITRQAPRYWLSRLMVAFWAAHLPVVTLLAPESLSGRALSQSGPIGRFMLLLLLVLSVGAIFDGVVNDILPDRFHLLTKLYRHVGFMAMAIVLVMLAFVIVAHGHHVAVVLSYLLAATFAACVAGLDMNARHRERRSKKL